MIPSLVDTSLDFGLFRVVRPYRPANLTASNVISWPIIAHTTRGRLQILLEQLTPGTTDFLPGGGGIASSFFGFLTLTSAKSEALRFKSMFICLIMMSGCVKINKTANSVNVLSQ